jgi:Glycosyltransferase family 92
LISKHCENAENRLEIIDNQPPNGVKKDFGVCMKQVTFPNRDVVVKFVEWIHLLRILGNHKVHITVRYVHPELYKIMNYLEKEGYIEVTNFLEPSGSANTVDHSMESFSLEFSVTNDCFYRVRNLYNRIIFIDIDEIPMPINPLHMSWHDMFESVKNLPKADNYEPRMAMFPPVLKQPFADIPSHMYMLQHVQVSLLFQFLIFNTNSMICVDLGSVLVLRNGLERSVIRKCSRPSSVKTLKRVNHQQLFIFIFFSVRTVLTINPNVSLIHLKSL